MVKKDRKKHKGFIKSWLENERLKYGKKKRKRESMEVMPVAKHELFSDNEEEKVQSPPSSKIVPNQLAMTPLLYDEKERGNESDQEKYPTAC